MAVQLEQTPSASFIGDGSTLGDALKNRVRAHWEQEACGSRYGDGGDRLSWFREISRKRYELEPYIKSFARFSESSGKTVLEIGVGAGSDFLEWTRYARHATGVDLTDTGVELTRERLKLERVDDARYLLRRADAETLPFEDGSFDIVYSWGVLHHTPDTQRAYKEAYRVLKPGGSLRTMIYHVPSWTGLMLYLLHGPRKGNIAAGVRSAIFHHLESPGTKAYTLAEARALAVEAGFEDVSASARLGPGDLLEIMPSRRYRGFLARLAWMMYPRPLIRALGDRFGLYLLLSAKKSQ